jgi:hypothetical protein
MKVALVKRIETTEGAPGRAEHTKWDVMREVEVEVEVEVRVRNYTPSSFAPDAPYGSGSRDSPSLFRWMYT